MTTNLLKEIDATDADPAEVESLFLTYYREATHSAERVTVYGPSDRPALEVRFSKSGRIESLVRREHFGAADTAELARRVQEEIRYAAPTRIGRRVMFSHYPLSGWFKFKDQFQILPVPKHAPVPSVGWGGHPFLLEVSFVSSPNSSVNMLRRLKRERVFELLCSGLLEPMPHAETRSAEFHWVHEPTAGGEMLNVQRQGGYGWPGANFQGDQFSDVSEYAPITEVDYLTYYGEDRSRRVSLDAPNTLSGSLEIFSMLPEDQQRRYLRACYWYQQSAKARSLSRSMFVVTIVSAVEALMPQPSAGPECPTCKRRQGVGPTKRFRDFVDQAAPSLEADDRRRFYELRSAIAHGGKLLRADENTWGLGDVSEWHDLQNLRSIVRTVLYNWLHVPTLR